MSHFCSVCVTSLLCLCDVLVIFAWHLCCAHMTSLLCLCDVLVMFAWGLCCVHVKSLLCSCDIFTVFVWRLCCVCVMSMLCLCDALPLFLWWLVSLADTKSSTHTILPLFNNFHWALHFHTSFSDPNKKSSRTRSHFISSQKTKQVFLTLSPSWL